MTARHVGAIAGNIQSSSERHSQAPSSSDTWLAMGRMLIGTWIPTTTVPKTVYDTLDLASMPPWKNHSQLHDWVISNVVESSIAIWLIPGGKRLSKLFWLARDAGTGMEGAMQHPV